MRQPSLQRTATYRHCLARQLCLDPAVWDETPSVPELALLAAVVRQAYLDATQSPRSFRASIIFQEAWTFFTEPGQLEWFCECLNWNPALLRAAVLATKCSQIAPQ